MAIYVLCIIGVPLYTHTHVYKVHVHFCFGNEKSPKFRSGSTPRYIL